MNNEDMSGIIQKLSSMINNSNNSNSSDNVSSNSNQTSYNNFGTNNENTENDYNDNEKNFNLDFETIMKIKNVMDKINSNKNSPEANLLMSLKPYLNSHRKKKLDQYLQFLNIAKILESFNSNGEVNLK